MNRNLKQRLIKWAKSYARSAYLMQNLAKNPVQRGDKRFVNRHLSLLYQAGFGLVELLVVVALIGILAAIAFPSLTETQQYYERFKVERITQQLLQEGRNTAFSLRQRINICGSRYGDQCNATDWQHGMLMFHDVNLDNRFTPEVDVILRFEPLNLKYGAWQWRGGVSAPNFVRFEHTSGMPHASFGSFHYCDFEQKHLFRLSMRNTGVLVKYTTDVRC